ncbi:MAG: ATP-binding protein [Pseudomonadota bacterium]
MPVPFHPQTVRPRKDLLVLILVGGAVSIALFGGAYAWLGHWSAAAVELGFLVTVASLLLWLLRDPTALRPVIMVAEVGLFLTTTGNTLATGGVEGSGVFVAWGLIGPLSAMVFLGLRPALWISGLWIAQILVFLLLPAGVLGGRPLPDALQPWFAAANVLGTASLCLLTLGWFLRRIEEERAVFQASERRLRDTERLESLAVLAGGIAHDFNNVLMALFGNLQLARAETAPGSDLSMRLEQASAALDRATALTRQLLTFASGGAPTRARASVGDTIQESASFILAGRPIQTSFEIAQDLWPVEADLDQISRLVQNLVLNASQAMPGGGRVWVRARNAHRDHPQAPGGPVGACVCIEVSDDGPGVPAALRAHIFEPFFSTRQGNSGLGLTSCFAIARDHGGAIELESTEGEGATFRVWLPALPASAQEPEQELTQELACPDDLSGLRVLVMDDEPTVLEVLCAMLDSLGHQPRGAGEGGEALAAWDEAVQHGDPYHVVILDLTVRGGMGGVETVRRLRERGVHVPIIASSGYVTDRVLADYRQFGFDAVLAKPYKVTDLAMALGNAGAGVGRA